MRSDTPCPNRLDLLRIEGFDMGEFTNVGASDEGLVARTGQDHAEHGSVRLCIRKCGLQIRPGRRI
jgi:hypothetical protein